MKYSNTLKAEFLQRINRFVAKVILDGGEIICHVKNTGRLGELLLKGAVVYLEKSSNPLRKTKYDLVATEKDGEIFNIDSYAPNLAAKEYLEKIYPDCRIKAEVKYGNSRFDFCVENEKTKTFVEVKGVTLIRNGVALFPDAPTERGVKHIRELIECKKSGFGAEILFVVQTYDVRCFSPNEEMHLQFAEALRDAESCGVKISAVNCIVSPDEMRIDREIGINLRQSD